jgi:hypothetical protein
MINRLCSVLCAFVFAACGGDSIDTSTLDGFLTGLPMKYCDQAFKCKANFPTDAEEKFEDIFGNTVQECYSQNQGYDPMLVDARIQAGTIKWNPGDAEACLSGIMYPACDKYWMDGGTYPEACETALVGTIAVGGVCEIQLECAESYCDERTKKCTAFPNP